MRSTPQGPSSAAAEVPEEIKPLLETKRMLEGIIDNARVADLTESDVISFTEDKGRDIADFLAKDCGMNGIQVVKSAYLRTADGMSAFILVAPSGNALRLTNFTQLVSDTNAVAAQLGHGLH